MDADLENLLGLGLLFRFSYSHRMLDDSGYQRELDQRRLVPRRASVVILNGLWPWRVGADWPMLRVCPSTG